MHERFAASSLPKHPVCVHAERTRLHVMHPPFPFAPSLSFSLSLSSFTGESDFRRSMQNIRPAVPTRVIRGRSVKPSSGNLYNRPLPSPISLMVISNRKLLFTTRRTLSLGTPSSKMPTQRRPISAGLQARIHFIVVHLARGAKFRRGRKQGRLTAETSCIGEKSG